MPKRRNRHPVFARYYVWASRAMDTGGLTAHRHPPARWSTPASPHVSGIALRDP